MIQKMLRRIVLAVALLATATASNPRRELVVQTLAAENSVAVATGNGGWLSMFGCTACIVAGAAVVLSGPGAILIAVNTPGGVGAAAACVAACYSAFK